MLENQDGNSDEISALLDVGIIKAVVNDAERKVGYVPNDTVIGGDWREIEPYEISEYYERGYE
jgi:hypothetical protein